MTIVADPRVVTKQCGEAGCRTEFTYTRGIGRPRMWCDHHARKRRSGKPITIDCPTCGASFETDANRVRRYSVTYCSQSCMGLGFAGKGPHSDLPDDHPARWYGATCEWTAPEPKLVRNTGSCAWCDGANSRRSTSAYCSEQCSTKAHRMRRRGRAHAALGTYTYGQLVKLWIKFDRCCAYCESPTTLDDIQAEHVTPLSRGGENHIGNLLPSCGPCNSDKRNLFLSEWNADRARRGLPPVRTQWGSDDPRFTHLTQAPWR